MSQRPSTLPATLRGAGIFPGAYWRAGRTSSIESSRFLPLLANSKRWDATDLPPRGRRNECRTAGVVRWSLLPGASTFLPAPRTEVHDIKLIAFYLPQFHAIPENDAWWGNGFTEWVNVRRARSNFVGHYQPHVPAELGYYDLLAPETRAAQAALARAHGIHGFCYYHYRFNGKRLLERPLNAVLESREPEFP